MLKSFTGSSTLVVSIMAGIPDCVAGGGLRRRGGARHAEHAGRDRTRHQVAAGENAGAAQRAVAALLRAVG